MQLTRENAARRIAKQIESFKGEDYSADVWVKGGRCRIYIKDNGYKTPKDQGFVHIDTDGSVKLDNLKGRPRGIERMISEATEGVTILDDPIARQELQMIPSRLPSVQIEPDSNEPPTVQSAIHRLNRQFGQGGWTQADLDDELG